MKQVKKEIIENHEFIVYTLMPEETLDTVTLGMMENNSIHGLLPVSFLQKDEYRILRYDITGTTVLADFLEHDENGLKLLLLLKGMADDLLGAKEYMIEDSSFLYGMYSIFVGEDGTGKLVCMPVENRNGTGFHQFCADMMHQPVVIKHMAYGPLSQVKTYLTKENFSIKNFSMMLDKIELRSAISASALRSNEKQEAVHRQSGPVVFGKQERISNVKSNVQVRERKKETAGYEPVILSKRNSGKKGNAERRLFEEDRTQLMLENKRLRGYLYRILSQEKKEIDKSEFRIGKSRVGTDYCVNSNPAVSRQHAVIIQKGDSFYIKDTNSLNHTYINNVMLEHGQIVKLTNGDAVRLADEEFLFTIEKE